MEPRVFTEGSCFHLAEPYASIEEKALQRRLTTIQISLFVLRSGKLSRPHHTSSLRQWKFNLGLGVEEERAREDKV